MGKRLADRDFTDLRICNLFVRVDWLAREDRIVLIGRNELRYDPLEIGGQWRRELEALFRARMRERKALGVQERARQFRHRA